MNKKFGTSSKGLLVPVCLAVFAMYACQKSDTARSIFSTRWLTQDSILAYGVYESRSGGGGSVAGGDADPVRSLVQIYTVDVTTGCAEKTEIHRLDNAVPCYSLSYRSADSLLYFSYMPWSQATKGLAANCGWEPDSVRLEAGIVTAVSWDTPSQVLDTATVLGQLGVPAPPDVDVSPYGSICPPGCSCFHE
jgi:hypothetical protein